MFENSQFPSFFCIEKFRQFNKNQNYFSRSNHLQLYTIIFTLLDTIKSHLKLYQINPSGNFFIISIVRENEQHKNCHLSI